MQLSSTWIGRGVGGVGPERKTKLSHEIGFERRSDLKDTQCSGVVQSSPVVGEIIRAQIVGISAQDSLCGQS